jgi:hypothetical protein
MRWMMLLGATCLLAACASQPETAPEPATVNTSGVVTEEELAREMKSYKKVEKEGKTLYCRTEQSLGSRLPLSVCLTHAQLTDSILKTREVTDRLRRKGGGECGKGGNMGCN